MGKQSKSPTGLRIIHAIVFLGFASAALAATHQELLQLWRALTDTYSAGTPPHVIACASGLASGVFVLVLLACVALGRSVPLAVSAIMLAAFAGSLTLWSFEPKQRSVPGANVKSLEQARELHTKVNEVLQKTGRVPPPADLPKLSGESPFTQSLKALPWHVEAVKKSDVLPNGAQPGWILVERSEDAASFVVTAVGISDSGEPSLLRQDGKPVEYRGAYNPDTPP